ncbi:MAG: hypothetical protein ACLR2G_07885 [Phascolarctobacterium faecium]
MTAENRRFYCRHYQQNIDAAYDGFAAYVVGAVHDLLLKGTRRFDVATSARPESVISILEPAGFTVVGELGQNFGVVVVHRDSQTVKLLPSVAKPTAGIRINRSRSGIVTTWG